MSVNLMQQLNSIPNVSGNGVPVQTYANTMQKLLTSEMTKVPNQQIATLASTTSALNSVETALQQLQTATQTLASAQTWTPTSVTSSDKSLFTVSGGPGAPIASFGVTVTNLAQNQLTVAQVSLTSASSSGTFYIYGGTSTTGTPLATIAVSSGESLSDIVSAINADSSTTNVQAFVLNGNKLALQSTKTGTAGAFTLMDGTGNFISTQTSMSTTQTGTDASISIGGTTVTSSTDTFSNVVPGVTLTAVASGTGTLSISQDTSGVVTAVQNWMSAYNSVIDLLSNDTQYVPPATGSGAGTAGPLSGDPSATGLLSQLPNSINTIMSSGTIQSLAAVGIVLNPNTGHLQWQSSSGFKINGKNFGGSLQDGQTMFQNALNGNLNGTKTSIQDVESIFGVVPDTTLSSVIPTSGVLGNVNNVLNQFLGFGSTKGVIPTEMTSISDQTNSLNQYLNQVNQMISSRVATFTAQLNALNSSLAKSQAQMQTIQSLFGTASSSSGSSSGSGSSSSSSSGG